MLWVAPAACLSCFSSRDMLVIAVTTVCPLPQQEDRAARSRSLIAMSLAKALRTRSTQFSSSPRQAVRFLLRGFRMGSPFRVWCERRGRARVSFRGGSARSWFGLLRTRGEYSEAGCLSPIFRASLVHRIGSSGCGIDP